MPACAVTFWCGKQTGESVTWDIDVDSGRVFSYWPGRTNTDGRAAGLKAALVDAGKAAELTSQGNTCAAHLVSNIPRTNYDPLAFRLRTKEFS